ncbi:MAG: VOC family protein [Deltaproteobacteria bacterium]|nr:VOC family protein [Deltaproteobacteria bacterium]
MIKGLHHAAYRCRDSEETRKFYEGFLGLPLAGTLELDTSKTRRPVRALHTFYEMGDGSYLAFFQVTDSPFEFKEQHDFDLHIAVEVDHEHLEPMLAKGRSAGIDSRGISHHGSIDSIYFRDPNGYVVELTAKLEGHAEQMDPDKNRARPRLDAWMAENG